MLVGIKLHIHLCVCSFCLFLQNNVFCQILGTGSVLPDWRTSQPDPNLPHNSNVWYFLFAKFCLDIQIACRASKYFFYLFFIVSFMSSSTFRVFLPLPLSIIHTPFRCHQQANITVWVISVKWAEVKSVWIVTVMPWIERIRDKSIRC